MPTGYATNTRRIALSAAFGLLIAAGGVAAEPREYTIDPDHMSVAFMTHHVGYYDLVGMFTKGKGSFTFDEEALSLSDVRVAVETGSVFTGHRKRDDHLRSPDFLNAREFPEMVFVGTSSERTGERTGKIHGELTLLGKTLPLTLDVTWNKAAPHPLNNDAYTIGIDATGSLRRSDFGMTYAVDNGWVGDEVRLLLGFEATRRD